MPVQKFVTRLRGIGYDGYVTVEWEKAWLPATGRAGGDPAGFDQEAERVGWRAGRRPRRIRQRAGRRA